ncbi:MAG: YncE family protein [Terriglobia bacterium]
MTLERTLVWKAFLLGTIVIGVDPAAGQTPSPALVVSVREDSTLAIIDPIAKRIVGRVPTAGKSHEVAVSTDGKLAFAGNRTDQGDSISVIDLTSRKELRRFDIGRGNRPHTMFFVDGKLYFTSTGYKLIACYDPARNQMEWLVGSGQADHEMFVPNQDASLMFTANSDSDSVTVFERIRDKRNQPSWKFTVIPVGKGPHGIDISPDGKEVWTAHERDDSLQVIDVATKKVRETLHIQTTQANRLKITPDGKRVLVVDRNGSDDPQHTNGPGELVVFEVMSRKVMKRIKLGKLPTGLLIEPNGKRAYVSVSGDAEVAIVDLEKLEVTDRITMSNNPKAWPEGMAWVEQP